MSEEDLVRTRNTRTGDARKIDEWSIPLPGGLKAKFDVFMRYEHGMCVFSVESNHPDFLGVRPFDTDLNRLRHSLGLEAKTVIEGRLSEDWTEAAVLEVQHRLRSWREGARDLDFELKLRFRAMEVHDIQQTANIPVATVRDAHRLERLVIRSHREDFRGMRPKSGGLTDPEVLAWLSSPASRDSETGLGRTVRRGDGEAELRLLKTLQAFSTRLSDRLSPDRVDIEGFPDPEVLVDLMREALVAEEKAELRDEPCRN